MVTENSISTCNLTGDVLSIMQMAGTVWYQSEHCWYIIKSFYE